MGSDELIDDDGEEEQFAVYAPRGAVDRLFFCRDREVLLEGPAGTGKTRGLLEYIHDLCWKYPGIRVLIVRQVKADLAESVLNTFEEHVLVDVIGEEVEKHGGTRINRTGYTYPWMERDVGGKHYEGESHIVVAGLDRPHRTFSQEYDFIGAFEGWEVSFEAWIKMFRCLRNWRMPWQQIVMDTNPAEDMHWANLRADDPYVIEPELAALLPPARPGQTAMSRLVTVHEDNPRLYDRDAGTWTPEGAQYISTLDAMPEGSATKERLRYGNWVAESGLVWPEFRRADHVIDGYTERDESTGDLYLVVTSWNDKRIKLKYTVASVDWGFTAPGCFQVWGVDEEERLFMLAEVYRTQRRSEWWADWAEAFYKEFAMHRIWCDPEEPERLSLFRKRLKPMCKRDVETVVAKAKNAVKTGIDLVGDKLRARRFAAGVDERPGAEMFFLASSLRGGRDESLAALRKPTSSLTEVGGYVWPKAEDGKPIKDKPDPTKADHGMDCWRYVAMGVFGRDFSPPKAPVELPAWSYGKLMGVDEVMARSTP